MSPRGAPGAALAFSVLFLVLILPITGASANVAGTSASAPAIVPTQECACQAYSAYASGSSLLRGHGPPTQNTQTVYDEQLGITFTQSFTSLEYNVTAVAQTDPSLDTGPAYLLNGLADNGFWYQVGFSWNWGPGQTPGTGFDMNYEVYNSFGTSVDPPANQGGGLVAFSGPVNQGDTVVLNLYFDGSGDVVMLVEDLNTGSYAEQTFSAAGGTYFLGLPDSVANANGFFTGLMTEWYHGAPYYANLQGVTYSTNFSISSGWLWMDEFNPSNNDVIFAANASSPASFTSEPATLQEFSYNSTTVYANATEFISGSLNSTATGGTGTGGTGGTTAGGTPQVAVSFGYSVLGGGSGYASPVLTYTSNGTQRTASLGTTATTYELDNGSQWSVSDVLPGSSASERWVANGTTSGTATENATVSVDYQNQYYLTLTVNDAQGGAVQPSNGWEDAGTAVQVQASANSGWKLEGWSAEGQSIAANGSSLSMVMVAPTDLMAIFYPELVVTAPSSASVSYTYVTPVGGENGQGTVPAGTTESIYLPPSSEVVLAAQPTSFLYSATWNVPGFASRSSTVAIEVLQPASISAQSAYDYTNIGIVAGIALLLVAVAALAMRRKPQVLVDEPVSVPEGAPAPPPPEGTPDTGVD